MPQNQRATLPQEFHDHYSDTLLLEPRNSLLHARLLKMSLAAALDVDSELGLPIPGRQWGSKGAQYQTDPQEAGLILQPDGIYSEAIRVVPELGKAPGHTVRMDRPVFATSTYTQASREIPEGQVISVVPINIGSVQVDITLRRFGGPYDQANSRVAPYGVGRFDGSLSKHKPAQIVGLNLKDDFDQFCDFVCVKLLDTANIIVRPEGFTADNDHAAANDGPMSWRMMQSAERQLDEANVRYFPNGRRAMVLKPRQTEQLSLDPEFTRLAKEEADVNPIYRGTYFRSIGTWDIFKSNTLTTVSNSSSVSINYGQAFGPGAVGAGCGDMPRTAEHTDDNYGENVKVIWLWYAGFGVLDNRFIASLRTS